MGCESKGQIQVQVLNITKLSFYLYLQGSDVGSALLLVRWLGMPTTLGRGGGGGGGWLATERLLGFCPFGGNCLQPPGSRLIPSTSRLGQLHSKPPNHAIQNSTTSINSILVFLGDRHGRFEETRKSKTFGELKKRRVCPRKLAITQFCRVALLNA